MTRTPTVKPLPVDELEQIVHGEHGHPHAVLGAHPHEGGVTVRVLKPLASRVAIRHEDASGSSSETEASNCFCDSS